MSHDYVGDGFWVRVGPDVKQAIYVTVTHTNATNGTTTWHDSGKTGYTWHHLTTNFFDNHFPRNGWETVVFKDVNNTRRHGLYLQPYGKSYYITFNGWEDSDIKREFVRKQ